MKKNFEEWEIGEGPFIDEGLRLYHLHPRTKHLCGRYLISDKEWSCYTCGKVPPKEIQLIADLCKLWTP